MNIKELIKESNAIEGVYDDSEIDQSLKAWDYLLTVEDIGKEEVLETHRIIMDVLNHEIAGKFRKLNVRVGESVKIPWKKVIRQLELLIKYKPYNGLACLDWHIQFEQIHPFEDGNGRTGRMIYFWHCSKIWKEPIMFREKDKRGYYSLF